jgi:phage baseplate assembly protein gpV
MDTLENVIFRCIERFMAGRFSERHGMVTSYDPDKHLAKVMLMPDGLETGWIPIEESHMGQGFGIAVGLTPGDGKSTGDQVIVRCEENDFESFKVTKSVHSSKDKPPKVESGEMVFWTKWGQQIRFNKDGSLTLKTGEQPQGGQQQQQGGGGGQTEAQQTGGPTVTIGTPQVTGQTQQQQQQKKTMIKLDAQGNITTTADNDQTHNAQNNYNTTAKNITDESQQTGTYEAKQTLHDDAPTINHWANGGGGGPYNPGL